MLYDRYYYSILSAIGKRAYRILYDGIENFSKSIVVSKTLFCENSFDTVIEYLSLDNPHIFYVDFLSYRYMETPNEICFQFTYWYSPADVVILNTKMQTALNKILTKVQGFSQLEKEKSVHDLLVNNVVYNDTAITNLHMYAPRSNTVLGVLFYKSAVCEGISKTTKMLLNLMNIKCIIATGDADNSQGVGPHAWNIVKVDGKTYHLDITWDIGGSTKGRISYSYFNLLDSQIKKDHFAKNIYPKTTTV